MKLDIGADEVREEGWTPCDLRDCPGGYQFDMTQRWPFEDHAAEAVRMSHVLEHVTPEQAHAALREAHRVLTPRAELWVEVPDLEWACHQITAGYGQDRIAAMTGLYGFPGDPGHFHQWAYDTESLLIAVTEAGFEERPVRAVMSHGMGCIEIRTLRA